MGPILQLVAALSLLPSSIAGYTWQFAEQPKQCKDVTINVSGGTPPYRILVIPFGATPLSTNKEVRRITEKVFDGTSSTAQLSLKYPANSQFVAVMSDATGFGSGGTTTATQIAGSDDASCFDSSKDVTPNFTFAITPENQIVQCQSTRIWWDPANVQGDTSFLGIIPGGLSFAIPQKSVTQVPSQGTGFDWTVNVRSGNTLYIVGGDSRGNGTGGSIQNTVSAGTTTNNGGCIDNSSPSSTPGTPAGAVATQTGSSGGNSTTGSGSGGDSNPTGAIVGGVVGGLVGAASLFLIAWFFMRKRKESKIQKERPVDLLVADDQDEPNDGRLPQYYEPEPFIVPDPTVASSTDAHTDYRTSLAFSSSRSGTPDPYSGPTSSTSQSGYGGGKKGQMRPLRPVNIIQHEDAGPEGETIELPPAYTNLKPSASNPNLANESGSSTLPAGAAGPSVPTNSS